MKIMEWNLSKEINKFGLNVSVTEKNVWGHTVHVWMLHHLYLFFYDLQWLESSQLWHQSSDHTFAIVQTWKRNTWNIIKSPLPHIHNVDTNRLPKAAWVVSNLDLRGWLGPSSNVDQRCRSHPLEELPPTVSPNTRNVRIFLFGSKKQA